MNDENKKNTENPSPMRPSRRIRPAQNEIPGQPGTDATSAESHAAAPHAPAQQRRRIVRQAAPPAEAPAGRRAPDSNAAPTHNPAPGVPPVQRTAPSAPPPSERPAPARSGAPAGRPAENGMNKEPQKEASSPASAGRRVPASPPNGKVTVPSAPTIMTPVVSAVPPAPPSPDGRKKKTAPQNETAKDMASSLLKAVIYIVSVMIISGILSFFVINISNDVFAFVKSDAEVIITIDQNDTLKEIADTLKKNDVIKYKGVFKTYANLKKKNENFLHGTFTVSPSMSYDELLRNLRASSGSMEEISVTLPEGLTVDETIDVFVNAGIGTREGFVKAINQDEYDFWFVEELPDDAGRKYRLEGYLFPDTYYFYTNSTEHQVINRLLTNFSSKFDEAYKERCTELNLSVDEIVTLASMIQSEGKYLSDYGGISSVFHNRLNNTAATGGRLESDATVYYGTEKENEVTDPTQIDTGYDNPYNTYLHEGLPPGAISNPSLNALHYALYPDDTNNYYFLSLKDGTTLFARTAGEHEANKILMQSEE